MTNVHLLRAPEGASVPAPKTRDWRKHKENGLNSLYGKTSVIWHAIRAWMPHLSPPEFKVLIFILDRTVNWEKTEARFTRRLIARGDGSQGGTGIQESRVSEILASLEALGLIEVDRSDVNAGMLIRPNLDWEPQTAIAASEQPKTMTGVSIERTFRRAFDRAYAGIPGAACKPWTEAQRREIAEEFDDWWPKSRPDLLHAFIEWAVHNWSRIEWEDGKRHRCNAQSLTNAARNLFVKFPNRDPVEAAMNRVRKPANPPIKKR